MAAAETVDAVVVGAGLAGLTAARILHRLGYQVAVLEQHDEVGGRIRTDLVDGFRLDHGFQLFNPAYPAGPRTFDYAALDLRRFAAGVDVVRGGSSSRLADPRRAPREAAAVAWNALRGAAAPPWELAPFAAYAAACGTEPIARLRQRPDRAISAALAAWGVGRRAVERVVAPFLSGVFADVDLRTSRRYADLVLRTFVRGTPAVPASGMQALPAQIAADLPAHVVRTGTAVTGIDGGAVTTGQGSFGGRVVLIATDGPSAMALLPGLSATAMAALTTWYFALDRQYADPFLIVDGSGSPWLCNVAVMTAAAPEYSSSGQHLVAASAVGHHDGADAGRLARLECARLLGVGQESLDPLGCYPIRDALPRHLPGTPLRRNPVIDDRTLVIGDHRSTPSIQGAITSGEQGAVAAARILGPVPGRARG
jgi:glycine/D-amino acid oxidase-like deaminating enzyme